MKVYLLVQSANITFLIKNAEPVITKSHRTKLHMTKQNTLVTIL